MDMCGPQMSSMSSSQLGPIRRSALDGSRTVPYDPSGDVRQSQFHFLFPSTTINIAPGPQNRDGLPALPILTRLRA